MDAFGAAESSVISRLLATCRPFFMAKLTLTVSPIARFSSVADFSCFKTDVEGSAASVHVFPWAVRIWKLGDAAATSSAVIEPSIEMIPSSAGSWGGLAIVAGAVLGGFMGGGAFGLAGARARVARGGLVGGSLGATGGRACGDAGRDIDSDVSDLVGVVEALDPVGAIVDLMTVILGASDVF